MSAMANFAAGHAHMRTGVRDLGRRIRSSLQDARDNRLQDAIQQQSREIIREHLRNANLDEQEQVDQLEQDLEAINTSMDACATVIDTYNRLGRFQRLAGEGSELLADGLVKRLVRIFNTVPGIRDQLRNQDFWQNLDHDYQDEIWNRVDRMRTEAKELKAKVDGSVAKQTEMTDANLNLRLEKGQLERTLKDLQEKTEKRKKKINALKAKISGMKKDTEQGTSDDITRLEAALSTSDGNLAKKEKEVEALEGEKEAWISDKAVLDEAVTNLEADVETKTNEKTKLESRVAELENEQPGLQSQIAVLESEKEQWQSDKAAFERQVDDLGRRVETLASSNANLQAEKEAAKNTAESRKIANEMLNTEKSALEGEKSELNTKVNQLESENSDLRGGKTTFEQQTVGLKTRITNLENDVGKIRREKETAEQENANLKTRNSALANDKTNLENTKTNLASSKSELEAEKSRLQSNNDDLKKRVEGLETRVVSLEGDKSGLQADNAEFERRVEELNTRVGSLEGQNDTLENTNKALKTDKDNLQAQKEGLESHKESLEAERGGLKHDKKKLEAERDGLQSDKQRLETEVGSLKVDKDSLEAERDGLQSNKESLEAERNNLQAEVDGLQNNKDAETEDLEAKLEALEDELKHWKDMLMDRVLDRHDWQTVSSILDCRKEVSRKSRTRSAINFALVRSELKSQQSLAANDSPPMVAALQLWYDLLQPQRNPSDEAASNLLANLHNLRNQHFGLVAGMLLYGLKEAFENGGVADKAIRMAVCKMLDFIRRIVAEDLVEDHVKPILQSLDSCDDLVLDGYILALNESIAGNSVTLLDAITRLAQNNAIQQQGYLLFNRGQDLIVARPGAPLIVLGPDSFSLYLNDDLEVVVVLDLPEAKVELVVERKSREQWRGVEVVLASALARFRATAAALLC